MAENSLAQTPPRMTITNVDTGEGISAQFNPDEVKEKIGALFTELEILGLSHRPQQFKNSDNLQVSFDLSFDSASTRGIELSGGLAGGARPDLARRFLLSLCYPMKAAAGDIVGGGPPRVLFSWPELFSIVCRMRTIEITHKRFSKTGGSSLFTAAVVLHEARVLRLTSEDVFNYGTIRGEG